MTKARTFPSVVKLLGTHLVGRPAHLARVIDQALEEARTVLDSDPWPAAALARERLAALLWAAGLYGTEPDDEVFAWLVAKGFDVQGEIVPETHAEAPPIAPEPPPVPDPPDPEKFIPDTTLQPERRPHRIAQLLA